MPENSGRAAFRAAAAFSACAAAFAATLASRLIELFSDWNECCASRTSAIRAEASPCRSRRNIQRGTVNGRKRSGSRSTQGLESGGKMHEEGEERVPHPHIRLMLLREGKGAPVVQGASGLPNLQAEGPRP